MFTRLFRSAVRPARLTPSRAKPCLESLESRTLLAIDLLGANDLIPHDSLAGMSRSLSADSNNGTISSDTAENQNASAAVDPHIKGTVYNDANENGTRDTSGTGTLSSTDVPKAVPAETTITSNLAVNGLSGSVIDVNVKVDITHTYDADVSITLISPTGQRILLSSNNGGSGDNYTATVFDDQAATPITSASPPFTGSFKPEQLLANLNGEDPNGIWKLEVTDVVFEDSGTLNSWSLTIDTGEAGQAGVTVYLDQNNNGMLDGTNDTLSSTDVPKNVPDVTTITSNLPVSGISGSVNDVNVMLDITHTFDNDLIITLISPTGTRILLSSNNGGGGDNYTATVFDDQAANPITSGNAPFTGSFKPEQALVGLNGENPNGGWKLEVSDVVSADSGTLKSWSLSISSGENSTVTDASGNYDFSVTAGTYIVREVVPGLFKQIAPAAGSYSVPITSQDVTARDFGNAGNLVVVGGVLQLLDDNLNNDVTIQLKSGDPNSTQLLTGVLLIGTFANNTFSQISVNLAGGDDNLFINGSNGNPIPSGGLSYDGGAGTDSLHGPNTTNSWALTGANSGTLNTNSTFSNVETLVGGSGNDSYDFGINNALGSITVSDAGGATDEFDFSASTTGIRIDLSSTAAQVINSNLTLTLGLGSAIENVQGSSFNDTLTSNSRDNTFNGGAGNDTYNFDTDSNQGNDTISDSTGTDTLTFASTTTQGVSINLGIATAQVVNSNLTLTLSSASTIENVVGGTLNDILTGNSLNNILNGQAGDDLYAFDTDSPLGDDTIRESGVGIDTLDFTATTTQDVAVNLGVGTAQVVNSNLTLTLGSDSTIENVLGGALNDILAANSLDNILNGGAGDDLYAFDTDSAQGNDIISESSGIDTLTFAATTTQNVAVNLGVATAQVVNSNLTLSLGSVSMENVVGTSLDDILTGNSLDNMLNGQAGNDTYFFDTDSVQGSDSISESGVGIDTLNFAPTTTKGVAVNLGIATAQVVNSNLTLTLGSASSMEYVVGSSLNDSLTGNGLNNVLNGQDGNDSYFFDTDSVQGSDSISESGMGIDTLNFAATSTHTVAVNLGIGTPQVVNSNLTLTLGSAASIENVVGGSLDDILIGNNLSNSLNGQGGDDTLAGQGGDDSYVFDTDNTLGNDTISDSSGLDTLNFAATTTKAVAVNLGIATAQVINSNLTLTLGSASTIENVVGGTLNDSLMGNSLNNILIGLAGNDTLSGELGNDTYSFDTDSVLGSDTIVESGGIDTLDFSATTTEGVVVNLGVATAQVINSNLNLTLGSAATLENVVGSALDDSLTGNSLNNVLDGQGGNDVYTFDTDTAQGSDIIRKSGGIGTLDFSDTTTKAVAVNLGIGIAQVVNSNLILTLGSASVIENVTGGLLNDSLTGNSLDNILTGLAGNDTLRGQGGNDIYVFDADSALGNDTISDSGGTDTLTFAETTTQGVAVNLGMATAQVINSNLTLTLSSASAIEYVVGSSADDLLTGNSRDNVLNGQGGDDTYFFDTDTVLGNDTISESGVGTDTLNFSGTTLQDVAVNLGVDTAQTVNSNLTLTLDSASTFENIVGGALNDSLTGNSLNNSLNGLLGNDTYFFGTNSALGSDSIVESGGTDTLDFSATTTKAVAVNLGVATAQVINSNLTLTLGSASAIENVAGGSLNDSLMGNSLNNRLTGMAGNDSLIGLAGNDVYAFDTDSALGNDTISDSSGTDTLTFALTTTQDVKVNLGRATAQVVNSNLTLTLGSASTIENVLGGALDDTLAGNSRNNILNGLTGNDTYVFDTDSDLGSDTISESGGIDTLDFSDSTSMAVVIDLGIGTAQAVNSNLTLTLGSSSAIENVVGGLLNDSLTGNSLSNILTGLAGNDTLVGQGGNDIYAFDTDSALGNDTISESSGIDTLTFVETTTKGVAVNLGIATAQVINSNLTLTLGSTSTIEYVVGGSSDDLLTGNSRDNVLNGQAGDDTYFFNTDSALGDDTISESGVGTDTLNFSETTTQAVAVNLGAASTQVVNSNLTLTLGSTSTIENVVGGTLNDSLTGNRLNNSFTGLEGNDTYFFGTNSALGSDSIVESSGTDTLDFSATTTKAVAVNLGVATAQVVNSNLTLTLGSASAIENVVGGSLNDSLTGNSLNNRLTGMAGNDSLIGLAGNDVYAFDTDSALGNDTISDSSGTDTLTFALTTTQDVKVNLGRATAQVVNSNLTLTLGSASTIENVLGGTLDDILTGNGRNNILNGLAGNDTYVFDTDSDLGSDTISESGGTDTLDFSDSTSVAVAIDLGIGTAQAVNSNLTLTLGSSSTIENVVGGLLNDSLIGNSLNNILTGLAGNDTLVGQGGNDIYAFDTDSALGNDTITESSGTDTLTFSETTTKGVAVNLGIATAQVINSNLTLTLGSASTIENVLGGSSDDILTGNIRNNVLNGQGGDDTYVFDTDSVLGDDTISESGVGTDTLNFSDTTTQAVAINLGAASTQVVNSNLTLTLGSAATVENALGGSLDDKLTGNGLNNVLSGGAGDDTLRGGDGRDILLGGTGSDSILGGTEQDVLLGALYSQGDNVVALNALMAEWGRTDQNYSQRIAHLDGSDPTGGLNGSFLLTTGTGGSISNDSATESLTGEAALDWFFSHSGEDNVTDQGVVSPDSGSEIVTTIP